MKKIIEYVLTIVISASIAFGIYFATIRSETEVHVIPTVHNALIETVYYKTDIFGHRTVVDFKVEKLNPYSD